MAAYIIFDEEVTDPTAADDYLKLSNESLTPFQSKTIVHGDVVEVVEGDWEPEMVVGDSMVVTCPPGRYQPNSESPRSLCRDDDGHCKCP